MLYYAAKLVQSLKNLNNNMTLMMITIIRLEIPIA